MTPLRSAQCGMRSAAFGLLVASSVAAQVPTLKGGLEGAVLEDSAGSSPGFSLGTPSGETWAAVVRYSSHYQEAPSPSRPFLIQLAHYGKWATLASAAGFAVLAAVRHDQGGERWDALEARCRSDPALCQTFAVPQGDSPPGGYMDPETERLYQSAVAADRSARRWMFSGQGALLATVALFVVDLKHRASDGPDNIPFRGARSLRVTPGPFGTANVGLEVGF